MKNYYELLEVREDASPEVIEMAYKALMRKYHPDVYRGDSDFAHDITQEINEAHNTLTDPQLRLQYDSTLQPAPMKEPTKSVSAPSKKTVILLAVPVILCILLGLVSLSLARQNTILEDKQQELQAGLHKADSALTQAKSENEALERENGQLTSDLDYYSKNACLTINSSRLYHHYGCPHLLGRSVTILDIKNARRLGYSPCPECWE